MAKFTIYLVVVVLAVLVDVSLSAEGWGQKGGGRPGFGVVGFNGGKCSAMDGVLPAPKSGCCGKHAEADGDNQGGDENIGDDNDDGIGNGDDGPGRGGGGNAIGDIFGPGRRGGGNGIGDIFGPGRGGGGNGIGDIFGPGRGGGGNGIGDIFGPGRGGGGNGIGDIFGPGRGGDGNGIGDIFGPGRGGGGNGIGDIFGPGRGGGGNGIGDIFGPGRGGDGNGIGDIFGPGRGGGGNGIGDILGPGRRGGGNGIGDIFGPGRGGGGNGIGDILGPGNLGGDPWGGFGDNGIGDIDFGNTFGGSWGFNEEYRSKRSADKNNSDVAPDKFIIAGRPAGIAQYPWLVSLRTKFLEMTQIKVRGCGGSLVSSRHVITAGHCLAMDIQNYNDVSIYLAEYNTRTFPTDCVGRQCIKNLIMHPDKISVHSGFDYNSYRLFNDIAMMRLSKPAPYTDYIRPICLPTFNINKAKNDGTNLAITGWGRTEKGKASPIKLHAKVQLVAPKTCKRDYPDLEESQICAASRNRQDTCKGDSGGPLMVEQDGNFYLVGLVSGKRGDVTCGSPVPTLYTNVYSHMKWIQNFMNN